MGFLSLQKLLGTFSEKKKIYTYTKLCASFYLIWKRVENDIEQNLSGKNIDTESKKKRNNWNESFQFQDVFQSFGIWIFHNIHVIQREFHIFTILFEKKNLPYLAWFGWTLFENLIHQLINLIPIQTQIQFQIQISISILDFPPHS